MTKRAETKVGDIFRTTSRLGHVKYLQLVYIDPVDMNSDVVIVFPDEGGNSYLESIRLPLEFYTHTTVKQGVEKNLWEKIGYSPIAVELRKLKFKLYRNQEYVDNLLKIRERNPNTPLKPAYDKAYWDVWTLGDSSYESVQKEVGDAVEAEEGSVYPAEAIVARIDGNYSLSENIWPND